MKAGKIKKLVLALLWSIDTRAMFVPNKAFRGGDGKTTGVLV